MSNYTKATNFASKDTLSSGDALKRIKGTEIDDEYNSISTAIITKANALDAALTGVPVAPTAVAGTNTTQLATTAYSTAAIAAIPEVTAAVVNALSYPVGSIYISILSTNPATSLGIGTWIGFGFGRTLVGINATDADFNTSEETGGNKTHTLTTAEMPAHIHSEQSRPSYDGGGNPYENESQSYSGSRTGTLADTALNTGSTGGGGAHDNLQPYIVVYFWKRTA